MKQRLYGFSVLAAVLAALTLSGPAMAAGKQVPFKGRSSGVVTAVGFDPVAGIAYTRVEGEGQATHLGHFTVTGDVAVDVATGIPQGTWTLTAANGDMLFLEMTGTRDRRNPWVRGLYGRGRHGSLRGGDRLLRADHHVCRSPRDCGQYPLYRRARGNDLLWRQASVINRCRIECSALSPAGLRCAKARTRFTG